MGDTWGTHETLNLFHTLLHRCRRRYVLPGDEMNTLAIMTAWLLVGLALREIILRWLDDHNDDDDNDGDPRYA